MDDSSADQARLESNSRLSLDRQTIARITEQKIDEIESAITQDYLKNTKAVRDAAILEQVPLDQQEGDTWFRETVLQRTPDDPAFEDEFLPTLFRSNEAHILFSDDHEE